MKRIISGMFRPSLASVLSSLSVLLLKLDGLIKMRREENNLLIDEINDLDARIRENDADIAHAQRVHGKLDELLK